VTDACVCVGRMRVYVCVHHVCIYRLICVSICVYGCCTVYWHALRELLAVLRLE
jgi:hypothetical protein